MAWQTQTAPWGSGAQSIAPATSVTADGTVGSAINVGRGRIDFKVSVASYVGGTGYDSIRLVFQANTLAATTTWDDIAEVAVGDASALGVARTSLSNAVISAFNQADNQVRVQAHVNGSAVSATVTVDALPLGTARA